MVLNVMKWQISAPKTHWMVTNAVPLVIIALCALFFAYHWRDLVVIMQIPMFWFIAVMVRLSSPFSFLGQS